MNSKDLHGKIVCGIALADEEQHLYRVLHGTAYKRGAELIVADAHGSGMILSAESVNAAIFIEDPLRTALQSILGSTSLDAVEYLIIERDERDLDGRGFFGYVPIAEDDA